MANQFQWQINANGESMQMANQFQWRINANGKSIYLFLVV